MHVLLFATSKDAETQDLPFFLAEFASNEDRRDLIAECNLMRRLDSHKNVVQLLGFILQTGESVPWFRRILKKGEAISNSKAK